MLKWQVFVFYELLETLEIDSIVVIFKGMIKTTIANICWTLSVLDTAPKHVFHVYYSVLFSERSHHGCSITMLTL